MRAVEFYFLAVIIASCRLFQQQSAPSADQERTFGELSAGEQLQYLRQVLAAQGAIIRGTRIARVKSLDDKLTHEVDVSVTSIGTGFQGIKLPRVHWSKVQADSIELLRCKVKNLTSNETIKGKVQPVINDKDFVRVQQEPNAYGFLSCVRVHGKIKNGTTLIDRSAENKFVYKYLFRPCFMNYAMVAPATSSTTEQCGEDSIKAAESTQAETFQAKQLRLVFRYCQKDQQQVCSSVISHTEEFAYNHGVQELPLELFEQRRAKQAEIVEHANSMYATGNKAMQSVMLAYNDEQVTALENFAKLQESHNKANTARREANIARTSNIQQVLDITSIVNQNVAARLANASGAARVAGERNLSYGNDCYQDYKTVKDSYEEGNEALKLLNADEDNEENLLEMDAIIVGGLVTMCVISVADSAYRIYKDYHNWNLASKGEVGLAIANVAVGLVPIENSELNKSSTVDAFVHALSGIFMREEDYEREHCQACLDHMNEFKHYSLKLFQLKRELEIIEKDIQRELTDKGVTDPYATP